MRVTTLPNPAIFADLFRMPGRLWLPVGRDEVKVWLGTPECLGSLLRDAAANYRRGLGPRFQYGDVQDAWQVYNTPARDGLPRIDRHIGTYDPGKGHHFPQFLPTWLAYFCRKRAALQRARLKRERCLDGLHVEHIPDPSLSPHEALETRELLGMVARARAPRAGRASDRRAAATRAVARRDRARARQE